MNEHEKYTALLDLYVDGELPETERAGLEAHLTRCPECAAYVADALAIRAAFPAWEDEDTEGFSRRVLSALPKKRRWAGPLALAACAAAAVFAGGVIGLGRGMGGAAPQEAALYSTGGASSSSSAAAVTAEEAAEDAVTEDAADSLPMESADAGAPAAAMPPVSMESAGEETDEPPAAPEITENTAAAAERRKADTAEETEEAAEDAPSASASAPETPEAAGGAQANAPADRQAALVLTAEEGAPLAALTPEAETEEGLWYRLTEEELAALARTLDKTPPSGGGYVLVER